MNFAHMVISYHSGFQWKDLKRASNSRALFSLLKKPLELTKHFF